MGALFQDRLAGWPSVVTYLWTLNFELEILRELYRSTYWVSGEFVFLRFPCIRTNSYPAIWKKRWEEGVQNFLSSLFMFMSYYSPYINFCVNVPKLLVQNLVFPKIFSSHLSVHGSNFPHCYIQGKSHVKCYSIPPSVSCVLTIPVALNRGTVYHTTSRFHGLWTSNNKHAIACHRCLVYIQPANNLNRV
jgi:hypothetical protein